MAAAPETVEALDPKSPLPRDFRFRAGLFATCRAGILGLAIYMGACEVK